MTRSTRRLVIAAAGVLLFATTSACGGSGSGATTSTSEGSGSTPVKISVGNLPIQASAALVLGKERGFFSDSGLDLTITPVEAPSMIPSLLSNSIQFGFLNPPAVLIARSNGVPVVGVETAASYPKDPTSSPLGLMVAKGSGISSPADLVGKTIAVDALGQVPHLSILNALRSVGVDPTKIKFTEEPYPSMPASLESGKVDAVLSTEPFMSLIKASGGSLLLSASEGMSPGMPLSLWLTTDKFLKNNKDTVEKFRQAIDKSQTYAQAHLDEVRAILPSYTKVKAEVAAKIQMYDYTPGYTSEEWDAWYKILKTEGFIKKDINPTDAYLPQ